MPNEYCLSSVSEPTSVAAAGKGRAAAAHSLRSMHPGSCTDLANLLRRPPDRSHIMHLPARLKCCSRRRTGTAEVSCTTTEAGGAQPAEMSFANSTKFSSRRQSADGARQRFSGRSGKHGRARKGGDGQSGSCGECRGHAAVAAGGAVPGLCRSGGHQRHGCIQHPARKGRQSGCRRGTYLWVLLDCSAFHENLERDSAAQIHVRIRSGHGTENDEY